MEYCALGFDWSNQSRFHPTLMQFLLPNVLLHVVEQSLSICLIPVPLDDVKSGLLTLQPFQHLMILIDDLLVLSQPLLVVQRLLGVLSLLFLREEVPFRRD